MSEKRPLFRKGDQGPAVAEICDRLLRIGAITKPSNVIDETFPDGQDIEVFKFEALENAWKNAILNSDREHVTPYIRNNSTFKGGVLFSSAHFPSPKNFHHIRMTVDEQVDFDVINELVKNLGMEKSWEEYVRYMQEHNLTLNSAIQRNEGYIKSLKNEQ